MRENRCLLIDGQKFRFTAARNYFKQIILQGLHIPNAPQTFSLMHELSDMNSLLGDRTWQSWFSSEPPLPQPSKIKRLDQYIAQIKKRGQSRHAVSICRELQEGYFYKLVHGGLMSQMLLPTKTSNLIHTLIRRAQEYQPASPLHLHFDAVDAAGWRHDFGNVPWSTVATIASNRILELLHDRWSPLAGSVYTHLANERLSSDLSARREEVNKFLALEKSICPSLALPNLFEEWIRSGLSPDWCQLGMEVDISHKHIYKLLFALAKDHKFLTQDRIDDWSLDLATSALAMHALAWTNRKNTMGLGMSLELIYWGVFDEIFFNSDQTEIDDWLTISAIEYLLGDYSNESVEILQKARHAYWSLLKKLGLLPEHISSGLHKTREQHPLIF